MEAVGLRLGIMGKGGHRLEWKSVTVFALLFGVIC